MGQSDFALQLPWHNPASPPASSTRCERHRFDRFLSSFYCSVKIDAGLTKTGSGRATDKSDYIAEIELVAGIL